MKPCHPAPFFIKKYFKYFRVSAGAMKIKIVSAVYIFALPTDLCRHMKDLFRLLRAVLHVVSPQ